MSRKRNTKPTPRDEDFYSTLHVLGCPDDVIKALKSMDAVEAKRKSAKVTEASKLKGETVKLEAFVHPSDWAQKPGDFCFGRPRSAKKRCETCGNRSTCNTKLLYGTHCDAWCERGEVHILMVGTLARKDGKYQYATDAGGESELSARDHAVINSIRNAVETIINDANNGGDA